MPDPRTRRSARAPGPPLPPGRTVVLPGRGKTWIWEAPGPPGAPTLVLLHGWTATAALNWFTALPVLGRTYHVVAMDLRGHGRGVRGRPFSLEACADDAAALCRVLEAKSVIAVGYSMGGPVAQLLWRRHPDVVGGLVLCATATHFSQPRAFDPAFDLAGRSLALGLAFVPGPAQREMVRRAWRSRFADTAMASWALEQRAPHDLSAVVNAGIDLRRYDARPWIGAVDVPTAVVATMRDQLVSPRRQLAMAEAIPGARVFPVQADHSACALVPRLFVPALVEACAEVAGRRLPADRQNQETKVTLRRP